MKKRLILCIFAILMIFNLPVSADSYLSMEAEESSGEYMSAEFSRVYAQYAVGENNTVMPRDSMMTLSIPRLAQADYNYPINSLGCALTCLTMANNFLSHESLTPEDVYNLLGHVSISWDADAQTLGIRRTAWGNLTSSNINDVVMSALSLSSPIIVKLVDETKDPSTHFVLVYGYQVVGSTVSILVRDPGGNNRQTIQSLLNVGWDLSYYHVFSK